MKPLISIIIPAYNVEEYIAQCIESIQSQTFDNYEVIVVDDGSSDNTLKIIKKYTSDKIKIFSQKNKGAGEARNVGIKNATGEYITFVDADDFYYSNDCLEKIVNVIQKDKSEVITYKMVRFYQKSGKYMEESDIGVNKKYKTIDYIRETIQQSRISISPCDKIIKKEIIDNNQIYFSSMKMLEDIDWSMKLYEHIQYVTVLNEPIYVYRKQREESTTFQYTKEKVYACMDFIRYWVQKWQTCSSDYNTLYLHYVAYQYIILLSAINGQNSDKNIKKELKNYKWLVEYDLNFKTKMANKIYHILGYNGMKIILKIYTFLKNKNLILIR